MLVEPIRKDLISLYESIAASLEGDEREFAQCQDDSLESLVKAIAECRQGLIREARSLSQPFRLGVVGMFKAGKSSFLNTLLGRELLKVDELETTTVITEMWHLRDGVEEHGEVVWKDGTIQNTSAREALQYTDFYSDVFEAFGEEEAKRAKQDQIDRVRIHLACDLLRDVVIVDTPGFGGSPEGDEKSLEALRQVDAAIMVFKVTRVGARGELEIADRLVHNGRQIVALLNFIDDNGSVRDQQSIQEARDFIVKHFATVVKDDSGVPLVFTYSAKEVLRNLCGDLASADQDTRVANLQRFGYLPSSEDGPGQGVIRFVRSRYFTSDSGVMKAKLDGARKSVLNHLNAIVGKAETCITGVVSRKDQAEACIDETEHREQEEVGDRVSRIERKVEDEIQTLVGEYTQAAIASAGTVIDSFAGIGLGNLRYLIDRGALESDMKARFRRDFPESRDRKLPVDISRRCGRILRNEWRSLGRSVGVIDFELGEIDLDDVMAGVSDALRSDMIEALISILVKILPVILSSSANPIHSLMSPGDCGAPAASGPSMSRMRAQVQAAKLRAANRLENSSFEIAETAMSAVMDVSNRVRKQVEQVLLEERGEHEARHHQLVCLEHDLQDLSRKTRYAVNRVEQCAL